MSKAAHGDERFRFGTVGAPASTPKNGGSAGGVARIRELNLSALELAWVQSVRVSDQTCAHIRAVAEENDVALSVHAPYFINLNALSDELWQAGRERLLAAARAGWKAGATDIIFHPGSYMKADPVAARAIAHDRLAEVRDTLNREANPVILRPETMGKRALLGTLEETLAWSQSIEGVLPCIDFAHLHARAGDGSFNTLAEFKAALALVKQALGTRGMDALHIHFSGIAYNEKGERHHLILAEADVNYKALFQALAESGGRGRVMGESPNQELDAIVMQNTFRNALQRVRRGRAASE